MKTIVTVSAVLLLAACGSSGAGSTASIPEAGVEDGAVNGKPSTPSSEANSACKGIVDDAKCEAPLEISTSGAFLDVIAPLLEANVGFETLETGSKLLPTRDLHATVSIDFDVSTFRSLHPACDGKAPLGDPRGGVCIETIFANAISSDPWQSNILVYNATDRFPLGVTCATSVPDEGCTKITIAAGTTLRFARSTLPNSAGLIYRHAIHVVDACSAPCASDEVRCGSSKSCIKKHDVCLLCDGGTRAACACQDDCVAKDAGSRCSLILSEDLGSDGVCTATGNCEISK